MQLSVLRGKKEQFQFKKSRWQGIRNIREEIDKMVAKIIMH